jgi:hypothetical protein
VGDTFARAVDLEAVGPGRYASTLDDVWTLRPLPQGGVVTAVAVRAMELELGHPDQQPRTLHTAFVGQVAHGALEAEVTLLRRGRSMSQARAEVRNPGGGPGHVTTCAFGSTRPGFAFTDLRPPDGIVAPEDCPSFRDPVPPEAGELVPMPFWSEVLEGRNLLGHPPWEPYEPQRAERATWYRFDDTPWLDDGRLDPLALVVVADTMPGAIGELLGPQDRSWFAPSVDLTVHLLGDCRSPWILGHNRARFAGDGYASVDMALWDCGADGRSEPRLVAYATQLCLFTFFD